MKLSELQKDILIFVKSCDSSVTYADYINAKENTIPPKYRDTWKIEVLNALHSLRLRRIISMMHPVSVSTIAITKSGSQLMGWEKN